MKRILLFLFASFCLLTSCIKDAPLNPEADIVTFSFPENTQRIKEVEYYNDYIISYPKGNVELQYVDYSLAVSKGATWERIEKDPVNDTLFFIKVTSESKEYTKTYSILQMSPDFPMFFDFENWEKYSNNYLYVTPVQDSWQWFSSNNGAAIAWSDRNKPAEDYLLRPTDVRVSGNYAAELRTMEGPGWIGSVRYIPCLAGSMYLGGFDVLTGLRDPLKSTKFGVPFNSGKPVRFTGYYMYQEGKSAYIVNHGESSSLDPLRKDTCAIYATLFKTDDNVQYLYGDNVSTSKNIIARAEISSEDIIQGNNFIYFDVPFDYDSFTTPFDPEELEKNEYKITVVFSSSKRGAYYEGRPGSRLVVDEVTVHWKDVDVSN